MKLKKLTKKMQKCIEKMENPPVSIVDELLIHKAVIILEDNFCGEEKFLCLADPDGCVYDTEIGDPTQDLVAECHKVEVEITITFKLGGRKQSERCDFDVDRWNTMPRILEAVDTLPFKVSFISYIRSFKDWEENIIEKHYRDDADEDGREGYGVIHTKERITVLKLRE